MLLSVFFVLCYLHVLDRLCCIRIPVQYVGYLFIDCFEFDLAGVLLPMKLFDVRIELFFDRIRYRD